MSYNPFGVNAPSTSIVQSLIGQTASAFSMTDADALNAGNGRKGVQFAVSVGDGRGSTRMNLTGDQIPGVVATLRSFDIDRNAEEASPAEVIARTIVREGDVVQFRVSAKPNARTVSIPMKEWGAFLEYMGNVDQWTEGAVAHYRQTVAALGK
jgi:hypothetical protein